MLETMQSAFVGLMSLQHLTYMLLGIVVGLGVGILPGLGGIAGMSLLMPFIYGMDPVSAIAMLVGMVAVIPTGDTFTSVLMGIPGSSASQATVLDGYPLAKKGQAARALSAAFSASLMGGVFGAILLTGFVVVAKPLILMFSTAELFMFAVLGLSVVGVLAGASIVRGVAACGLGIMFGAIGAAPATGESRFDLKLDYLQDGIPLVIIGLGLFAIPELAELMRRHRPIASEATLGSGWLQGVKDTFKHWFLVLRCSALGTFIGAIPGLGGGVVDWIAYGHVVQSSKDSSQFGKGDIRGVIAPESANNALQGGALMPTLLFGIPGSGSMAVFLGGMVLLGMQPGPNMVTTDLNLTYTIAWTLAIASIVGAFICFLLAAPIARLTFVPFNLIAPAMIMLICFAAFQARRDLTDLLVLFAIGILGIFLRRFGWPRPAFLIGFVLSGQVESYLYQALQFYGWGFLQRPGVLIIGALAVASLLMAVRSRVSEDGAVANGAQSGAQAPTEPAGGRTRSERMPQLVFAVIVLALFVYGVASSYPLSFLGAVFPLSTSSLMLLFTGFIVWKLVCGAPGHSTHCDQEIAARVGNSHDGSSVWPSVGWFAFLFGMTALIGFILSLAIFISAFLVTRTTIGWIKSLVYAGTCIGFMVTLGHFLTLDFPAGVLQRFVELPWPLK
ncbi:MAG: tripartite tricarboxylate transporter permease [Hydrogenophaga sp.]|uniref:tripartite tricarboxylate transporter permease n=1 Tax=Hydrogenophaga sp. TaxID=1904254 RepID=UPI002717BFEB|nr:tripartite tricarboxylate transporter permease [Hydrogenophaga sp.]MDO9569222.1 tripartite tricarboxylate transporter permease [Hydrogenophaga sp.]MDP3374543.1 tripartite tricarboxylate transporter permease [Hydrogenophaga sp.]